MAVESLTVGTLKARIHQALANTGTVDANLNSDLGWHINAVIRDLVQQSEHPAFRVDATVAFTAGDNTADLADDVSVIVDGSVRHNSQDYMPLHWFDLEKVIRESPYDLETSEGRPRRYTIRGRTSGTGLLSMMVLPIPDANYTLKYVYYAYPINPTISPNNSDNSEIDKRFPREFAHVIVDGVCLKYADYLTPAKLAYHRQAYEEGRKSMSSRANALTGLVRQRERYQVRSGYRRGYDNTLDQNITDGTIHH